MLETDLFKHALVEPVGDGADELFVVSGYATPEMATRHLSEVKKHWRREIAVKLVIGMTGHEGLPVSRHRRFQSVVEHPPAGEFACWYVGKGLSVHTKLYVWARGGVPVRAFAGSANYTQNGFGIGARGVANREVLVELDPRAAFGYWEDALADSFACDDRDVEDEIKFFHEARRPRVLIRGETRAVPIYKYAEHVTLPLFMFGGSPYASAGDIHPVSGLNWGFRPDGTARDLNEAYIPIPSRLKGAGFFPPLGVHFSVTTTDGSDLIMKTAQEWGKAIETPQSLAILGKYFRERLSVPFGQKVALSDLQAFGSRYVTFYKMGDEEFVLDYSPQAEPLGYAQWHR